MMTAVVTMLAVVEIAKPRSKGKRLMPLLLLVLALIVAQAENSLAQGLGGNRTGEGEAWNATDAYEEDDDSDSIPDLEDEDEDEELGPGEGQFGDALDRQCGWGFVWNGTQCKKVGPVDGGAPVAGAALAAVSIVAAATFGGPWLAFEFLAFAQMTCADALLSLPGAPARVVTYALGFFWSMFAVLPFDDRLELSQCAEVNPVRGMAAEELTSTSVYAKALKIAPRRLLVSCVVSLLVLLLVAFAVALANTEVQRRKRNYIRRDRTPLSVLLEAINLVMYMGFFPLVAFAARTSHLLFVAATASQLGCATERLLLGLLSGCVLTSALTWWVAAAILTRREEGTSFLRCGFRPGFRRFWIVQVGLQFTRGVCIGTAMGPQPLQPALLIALSFAYSLLLLWLSPFEQAAANKAALLVAFLAVLNGALPVLFAPSDVIVSEDAQSALGSLYVGLSLFSFAILAAVAVFHAARLLYMRRKAALLHRAGMLPTADDSVEQSRSSQDLEAEEHEARTVVIGGGSGKQPAEDLFKDDVSTRSAPPPVNTARPPLDPGVTKRYGSSVGGTLESAASFSSYRDEVAAGRAAAEGDPLSPTSMQDDLTDGSVDSDETTDETFSGGAARHRDHLTGSRRVVLY